MTFKIVNESILDQKVDAIVNPANSFLRHGGGLAKLIHDAASEPKPGENPFRPTLYGEDHMRLQRKPIPTGDAVAQRSTGPLPFKAIIHAVGPIWGGGELHEADLLSSAYLRSFQIACGLGYKSIAVPAISMGIFGVPREVVARVAVNAARQYAHKLDITICLTSDEDVDVFESFR